MKTYKVASYHQVSSLSYWYRLRVLSFYFVVFASGCAMTAYLLSLSPQAQLDGADGTKLSVLSAKNSRSTASALSRRGLYTSGTGGELPGLQCLLSRSCRSQAWKIARDCCDDTYASSPFNTL